MSNKFYWWQSTIINDTRNIKGLFIMWPANISFSLFDPCVHNVAQRCTTGLTLKISKFCPQNAFMRFVWHYGPIVAAEQSKASVCGRSLARTAGSNTAGDMDVCLVWVLCVVRYRQVSVLCWSLVLRSPTESGVSGCDCKASIMGRPWHTRGCCAMKNRKRMALWTNGYILIRKPTRCTNFSNLFLE